jgi:hypothetical protein
MDRDQNFIGYTPSEAAKKSDRSSNAGFSDPQTCTVLGDNFIKCVYIFFKFSFYLIKCMFLKTRLP